MQAGILKKTSNLLLKIIGTLCVLLGILGILLPLLPATPFFLLASACYVRSSEKLYNRLIENRYIGTYIKNFQHKRGLPLRAKLYTLILLWASLLFSLWKFNHPAIRIGLILSGAIISGLVLSFKTLRDDKSISL
jgi:uncharacterized protein